jgi:hypothetical protein
MHIYRRLLHLALKNNASPQQSNAGLTARAELRLGHYRLSVPMIGSAILPSDYCGKSPIADSQLLDHARRSDHHDAAAKPNQPERW